MGFLFILEKEQGQQSTQQAAILSGFWFCWTVSTPLKNDWTVSTPQKIDEQSQH